jgi:rifampicin phosphotransferase
MATAGLPVPPGFHVTTAAYRRFVEANALQAVIAEATANAQPDDPASLERASAAVRRLFWSGAAPEAVAAAIHAAYTSLGAAEPTGAEPAVAVRSSATAEDLPGLSFAGEYESYLNVRGESALLAAVQRCWASLWTARAISYRPATASTSARSRWLWWCSVWCRPRRLACFSPPIRRPAIATKW